MGIAAFLREGANPDYIRAEFVYQLDLAFLQPWAIPAYILQITGAMVGQFNRKYWLLDRSVPARLYNVGYVVEQPSRQNLFGHQFVYGLRALLEGMRPYATFLGEVVTVSPRCFYDKFKLPSGGTWALRKQRTKEFIEDKLKLKFSRHDSTDALSIGVGGLLSKKVSLTSTPFFLNCLSYWFKPEENDLPPPPPELDTGLPPPELNAFTHPKHELDDSSDTDYSEEEREFPINPTDHIHCL